MVGCAVRLLFALGAVLVVTLCLCNDETSLTPETSAPKELNADKDGGRTRLNGQVYEVDFSQLLKETIKGRQRSDIMGHIFTSAMKRLFHPTHSRQRRSSSFQKLFAALSRRKNNPYWQEMPPQAPTLAASTVTPATSTLEPAPQTDSTLANVVTIAEVNVLDFEREHLRAPKNRVMISTNADRGDVVKNFALILNDSAKSSGSSAATSAATLPFLATCCLTLLKIYAG